MLPFQRLRAASALHTCLTLLFNKSDEVGTFASAIPHVRYWHILWLLIHVLVHLGQSGIRLAVAHARHLLLPNSSAGCYKSEALHLIGVCMLLESQFMDDLQFPQDIICLMRGAEKYLQTAHMLKPNDPRAAVNLALCRLLIHERFPRLGEFTMDPEGKIGPEIQADFDNVGIQCPSGVAVESLLTSARVCGEHSYRMSGGCSAIAACVMVLSSLRAVSLERELSTWWSLARENPEYPRAFAFLRFNAFESSSGVLVASGKHKTLSVTPMSQLVVLTTIQVLCSWIYHLSGGLWNSGYRTTHLPFTESEERMMDKMLGIDRLECSPWVEPSITMMSSEILSWIDALCICTFGVSVINETNFTYFPLSLFHGYPIPSLPSRLLSQEKPESLGHDLASIIQSSDSLCGVLQAHDEALNHLMTAGSSVAKLMAHRVVKYPGVNRCCLPWLLRARQQTRAFRTDADYEQDESMDSVSLFPASASDLLPIETIVIACLEAAHSIKQHEVAERIFQAYVKTKQGLMSTSSVNQHINESNTLLIRGIHCLWSSRIPEAQKLLLESLALDPGNTKSRITLARAFFSAESTRDIALVRLSQCMTLCPNSQICKCLYGNLLIHTFANSVEQRRLGIKVLRNYAKGCPVGNMNIVEEVSQITSLEL
eukprot:Gregarina_sp_Poly_1__8631@NODE_512_length_7821_cov_61_195383_g399_i1_p1_GENE_NODE_512_length_7821_cov_61_195383_g399_i1NODE_512_length_7821_cov_61_195383_g399_i1_p1_ORF_typecomplete_len655_score71_04TPR_19/PF14559_6/0_064TPR_19/PF14559_6/0_066TPR_15/PF13429_6/5TPR_15/PF13429_6/0_27TPR_16/PF13432_6/2_5TPR_16/PF13432_6/3_2e03TPR_16/PF13432_6/4Coatomer_E/PF04733_14/41Coatomer_E/PF04733_14/0_095ANAPC3/PF12895_7/5e03ANAPC3/PF12895_7/12ANAPC3/PF12895_7/2_3ANAPC3/PF12895_7/5_6TPR_14/PF13428_6/3_2TPR_14